MTVRGDKMPRQVTAFSNTTVRRLRSLRDKKARREEGLFLAEGLRIIAEARDMGRLPEIVAFSSSGGVHPLAAEIIAEAETAGAEVIETSADILSKMSGKDNPQMLLGAAMGDTVRLHVTGPLADEAMEQLVALIENRFGEE